MHPKMQMLLAELNIPLYAAVGLMEMLWHWTAQYAPQGDIGKYPDQVIASSIGWTGDAKTLLCAFCACGWVDRDAQDCLVVHDWPEHADDAVHMHLARKTLYFADGTMPKMGRLGKEERGQIVSAYKSLTHTMVAQPTHKNAQETHSIRTESTDKRTASASASASASYFSLGGESEKPDPDEEFAVKAFDEWFLMKPPVGRGYGVQAEQNDIGKIGKLIQELAQEIPIIHGGQAVHRQKLIPLVIEQMRKRGKPMVSVDYAIGIVRGELAQWASTGPPSPNSSQRIGEESTADFGKRIAEKIAKQKGKSNAVA